MADGVSSLYSGVIRLWETASAFTKLMILELPWQLARRLECLGPRQRRGETQVRTRRQRGEPGQSREVPRALPAPAAFPDWDTPVPRAQILSSLDAGDTVLGHTLSFFFY